ncbi:MAG TPA: histidine phosphatase family protein [Solirubrobacteraceae bacterium]|jgi:phosphohistidine phosphatase|nr:histidine phosphatase family protein [Solirubrobacteraceae bacterium]
MSRQLWLLRHAEAEPHGTRPDPERRLTARGERQAHAAGAAIARLTQSFDAVLFSPKARARETAEIAAEQWDERQRALLRSYPALAEGFGAAQAREAALEVSDDGRVLVVGHEPDFSSTVAELTGGAVAIKKGGLAVVRLDGLGGELSLLLRPRDLALIAGVALAGVGSPADG